LLRLRFFQHGKKRTTFTSAGYSRQHNRQADCNSLRFSLFSSPKAAARVSILPCHGVTFSRFAVEERAAGGAFKQGSPLFFADSGLLKVAFRDYTGLTLSSLRE
jgi:hypothetical protein